MNAFEQYNSLIDPAQMTFVDIAAIARFEVQMKQRKFLNAFIFIIVHTTPLECDNQNLQYFF